jgi:serine protease Do
MLAGHQTRAASLAETVTGVQPLMVKVFGAGGRRGLEHYQSGFLISPEGHVLTVWSYVLDTEAVTAVLNDGRRFEAKLVGWDPRLEIAVLKIDATELPCFDLASAVELEAGDGVLAFSNLFGVATGDEDASVLHGYVAAKTTLAARRGAFPTPYKGPAYVLDAMTNNPGAAGGALTDRRGRLAGLLGKELRNALDNTWLNHALPVAEIAPAVGDILAGKIRPRSDEPRTRKPLQPMTLSLLGIALIPDVLPKTPPFIDRVVDGSPAAKAGLQADDLVLFVNDRLASSIQVLREELSYIDRIDEVRLLVQRGQDLVEVSLFAADR